MVPVPLSSVESAIAPYLNTLQHTGPTIELVRGQTVPLPEASPQRDRILQKLTIALTDLCRSDRPDLHIWNIPHLIRTGLTTVRLPDLSLIDAPPEGALPLLESAPALTVEIVAPSRPRDDYRAKRSEYAALGISEYWIIDPDNRKVSVMLWSDGFYDCTEYSGNTGLVSPRFPLRSLTVEGLFGDR
ncbi:MAG: Uma2 family endonuclease [Cyanobacteria bacterium]|nr:Uma2 family endonuclease [Cyanobacteriota bacterium]